MNKILLAFFASLILACSGFAQEKQIEISITTDKNIYNIGEKIVLQATFKNNSDDDAIIFWSTGIPTVLKTSEDDADMLTVQTSSSLLPEVKKLYIKAKDSTDKAFQVPTLGLSPQTYKLRLEFIPARLDLSNYKEESGQKIITNSIISKPVDIEIQDNRQFSK